MSARGKKCLWYLAGAAVAVAILACVTAYAAYPTRFMTARLTDATPVSSIDNKIGDLEQVICDALGVTINTDFSAPVVIPPSEKGAANGVATLGADGKVPAAQLPASSTTALSCELHLASDSTTYSWGTEIPLDTTDWDTSGFVNLTTHRIVIPAGLGGTYMVVGQVNWQNTGTTTNVYLQPFLNVNGVGTLLVSGALAPVVPIPTVAKIAQGSVIGVIKLNAGDQLGLTGTLSVTAAGDTVRGGGFTFLSVVRIGQ